MEELEKGYKRGDASLELVRLKNRFRDPTPSHFRFYLANLVLRAPGVACCVEIQLHLQALLACDSATDSHDHFEFFRTRGLAS